MNFDLPYNEELSKRFVSDYNLPIPIINRRAFFYHLDLYEKHYGAFTKYKKLWNMINEKFEGDAQKFLDHYYEVRESMIQSVLNNEAYQYFNTMPMERFEIKDRPNITSNNIYNEENVGKWFISVDLKKANFQALNLVDRDILLNSDTYEEFVDKFTDLEYIKESKYTRQVLFGKLNPKRHITVEKYYITNLYKKLNDDFIILKNKCVSLHNDEIVFQSAELSNGVAQKLVKDIEKVAAEMGLDVKVECFTLRGYALYSLDKPHFKKTFYTKEYSSFIKGKYKLISAPLPFHSIIYRFMNGYVERVTELDRLIQYEGLVARLESFFQVEKIEGQSKQRPEGTLLFNRNKKKKTIKIKLDKTYINLKEFFKLWNFF